MTAARRAAIVAAATILLPACTPELDDRGFQIAGPRLLAIAASPAEAGEPVGRAVDPDPTGGFYQPVRLRVSARSSRPMRPAPRRERPSRAARACRCARRGLPARPDPRQRAARAPSSTCGSIPRRVVSLRREAIRVSWFTTAGALAADSSGRAGDEAARSDADDTWTAPDAPGEARLWLVVRDDRGGVGWQSYRVKIE